MKFHHQTSATIVFSRGKSGKNKELLEEKGPSRNRSRAGDIDGKVWSDWHKTEPGGGVLLVAYVPEGTTTLYN